jgi:alpha-1,2-mannosyltransferase
MRTDAPRRREASAQRQQGRLLLAAGAGVFALAVAAYLAAIASHPSKAMLKAFDLQVYLDGGSLVRHAPGTLYSWHLAGMPGIQFTYTPFAALVFAALSFVPWRVLEDVAVVASTGALVTTVWIAFRALGVRDRAQRAGATLLMAGLAFWIEPVQRTLFLGQVELLLMALVVWDMCQPDRRRWKGAGVGLAAAIKLVPLIFIAYLVITRRFRAAGVAVAVFAATVVAGFAVLPHASTQWWLHGYFLQAGRTGFVGFGGNQSLRGTLTRFAGSAAHGQPPWIAVAIVIGVLGLAAATLLHRAGREFEGLMTCALTALLISPISWDHHWVWIAPFLAVLVTAGVRARDRVARVAWLAVAALLVVAFAGWPAFWNAGQGKGLIWPPYAPATGGASGDNPNYVEYHWHGMQLLEGNLYVLIGCALFALALAAAWALRADARDGELQDLRT